MFTIRSHDRQKVSGPRRANRHLSKPGISQLQAVFGDDDDAPVGAIVTGRYVRAARALLGWTQADLATRAKIGVRTVKRFEADEDTTPVVATAIERAFEDAGLTVFKDANQLANVGDMSVAIVLKTP